MIPAQASIFSTYTFDQFQLSVISKLAKNGGQNMPTYKNNTTMQVNASGILFAPGAQKETNLYLYNDNLTFISHEPYITSVIASEDFSVDAVTAEEYTWDSTQVNNRSQVEISISVASGLIKVFLNTETDQYISVRELETITLKVFVYNTNKVIIIGDGGAATGNIVVRKVM